MMSNASPQPVCEAKSRRLRSVCSVLKNLEKWVEERGYKGYDPGDGLTSFIRPLTFGNLFAERLLQQLIWKFPINLRPYVGIKPMNSTKGRGFMAWGYLMQHQATGDGEVLGKAYSCLDWLRANASKRYSDLCWGNHFDFSTRSGRMPAHEGTIVWSGLIGQAFLEAYAQTSEARFIEAAESVCNWILKLPRERTSTGNCLSYVAYEQSSIHNSNLLGAALLARTWYYTKRDELRDVAHEAVRYSCERQRADGSWFYGEKPKHSWIDNFHTGYNLDSLLRVIKYSQGQTFIPNMKSGYGYFEKTFFEKCGKPRYYHNKTFPVDIQCVAQAIDTFCLFAETEPDALRRAESVFDWAVANMLDASGYFYYRKLPMFTIRTPYLHWGQATMVKALSHLRLVLSDPSVCARNV